MLDPSIRKEYLDFFQAAAADPEGTDLSRSIELAHRLLLDGLDSAETARLQEESLRCLGELFPEMTLGELNRLMDGPLRNLVQCTAYACLYRAQLDQRNVDVHRPDPGQVALTSLQNGDVIKRFAGGLAHDYNNLLTAVMCNCALLLNDLPLDDPIREEIEEIQKAGQRAARLTEKVLAFSGETQLMPEALDINNIIIELRPRIEQLLSSRIELSLKLDPGLKPTQFDAAQFEEIIVNLVSNAELAMPNSGTLSIETADVNLSHVDGPGNQAFVPGNYIAIRVTDTGIGMDSETQAHIFEPFFTTRDVGQGVGLGLSSSWGIIKQSGGVITVDSAPGQGATFSIYLAPIDETVIQGHEPADNDSDRVPGAETILVVEDEDQVMQFTCEVLQGKGYTVLQARHGGEADRICNEYRSTIHLLLTDAVMPHMDCRVLAKKLLAVRPQMFVIFMSSNAKNTSSSLTNARGLTVLRKPYSPKTLVDAVRSTLDSSRRQP